MKKMIVTWILAAAIAVPASAADTTLGTGSTMDGRTGATVLAATPAVPLLPVVEGATDASGGSTILTSALWGGLAGAAIGTGVALIENGNWGRDIGIGAGAGLLIGGALGAAHAFGDTRAPYADGLRSPDRDPVITARTIGIGGRF
jgi:hypothetical protein